VIHFPPLSITTHVLDTSLGRPAGGVPIVLERTAADSQWQFVDRGETDADGRLRTLAGGQDALTAGVYRLVFDTRRYFDRNGIAGFYPSVVVVFEVRDAAEHYHVPLLISPFGYSTYRGS
jgi:5-hydroxyisourate hydrolase